MKCNRRKHLYRIKNIQNYSVVAWNGQVLDKLTVCFMQNWNAAKTAETIKADRKLCSSCSKLLEQNVFYVGL